MRFGRFKKFYGEEIVMGEVKRVVRIYVTAKKVTVDLSQVRDATWDKLIRVQAKYPNCTKIVLAADTDVQPIIHFWMGTQPEEEGEDQGREPGDAHYIEEELTQQL